MIGNPTAFAADGSEKTLTAAQKKDPTTAVATLAKSGSYLWLGLVDPDENEMAEVGTAYGLHPLAIRDATTGKQQPKVQSYKQNLFIVVWALLYEKPGYEVTISETFVFVRPGLLITVQRNGDKNKPDLCKVLSERTKDVEGGVMSGVYAVLATVAEGYTEISSVIERELEALEAQVFDPSRKDEAARIYKLRKQIGKVNRAVSSFAVALGKSEEHLADLSVGNDTVLPYFRDLLDDLASTAQLTRDQDVALNGVIATHENSVASQQNEDTRKISAVAAMLAIVGVVAGLYGMNFKNLPGVEWVWGWEVALGVTVIIEIGLYVYFRRRHWL